MSLPQTVPIRAIRDDARTIKTFVLDAEVEEAQPGQFIMLWLPGLDEKPMSIACPAPLTVTVDCVGSFTTALQSRKVGSIVGWRGPYGRGFALPEDGPALLLTGGCGVGPLYFLALRAVAQGVPTTVALGARTSLDLPYVKEFEALGVELLVATDDGSEGYAGYVTSLATDWLDRTGRTPSVYACGPEPMLVAVHRLCRERGLPGQLSIERYMKCGFGVCGQCAMDGLLVCQDGPVFHVEELDGVSDFGVAHRTATGRRLPIR
ncbi:MAG: dihydroorotate dehydrogenase electron transfer subunit [Anaerolineales bacterium]|nr:dihydroorotate dehydrogenase electron transfer subunit [Anaerolineales bacterium]